MTTIICDNPADLAASLSLAAAWTDEITGDFLVAPVADGVLVARVRRDADCDPRDWIGQDGHVHVATDYEGYLPSIADILETAGYGNRLPGRVALDVLAAIYDGETAGRVLDSVRDDWRADVERAADPVWWLDHPTARPVSDATPGWREYLANELPGVVSDRLGYDFGGVRIRHLVAINDALGSPLPMETVSNDRATWLLWAESTDWAGAVTGGAREMQAWLDGECYCLEWAVCSTGDIEDATGERLADADAAADFIERLEGMGTDDADGACEKLLAAAGDSGSICGICGAEDLPDAARGNLPETPKPPMLRAGFGRFPVARASRGRE